MLRGTLSENNQKEKLGILAQEDEDVRERSFWRRSEKDGMIDEELTTIKYGEKER